MLESCSRRDLFKLVTLAIPATATMGLPIQPSNGFGFHDQMEGAGGGQSASAANAGQTVPDAFPRQPSELVREMVLVSHYDLKRVQELVEVRPALARAAWDWGFGDWEDALGAASHMGNRAIAEYLISKGARPTLFSAAMLGQLDVVKGMISAQPGAQRIQGPHSISLLAHAKAGGDAARPVFDFLQSLGDAGADSEPPLSQDDVDTVKGTYVFGPGMSQVDVTVERIIDPNDMKQMISRVTWTRQGMIGRPLNHLGNRTFYPWGAPSVRIQFTEENGARLMTVSDGDTTLVARRTQ